MNRKSGIVLSIIMVLVGLLSALLVVLIFVSKQEIIRIYESTIIIDTITPKQGGIAYG